MSFTDMAALAVYMVIAFLCIAAAFAGSASFRPAAETRSWAICSIFFVSLQAVRLFSLEESTREFLRNYSRVRGEYEQRAALQEPLVTLVLLAGVALVVLLWISWPRNSRSQRTRLVRLSQFAILAFAPLYALRIISLHSVDQILYAGGPLRVNWVLEAALGSIVAGCSALYILRCWQSHR